MMLETSDKPVSIEKRHVLIRHDFFEPLCHTKINFFFTGFKTKGGRKYAEIIVDSKNMNIIRKHLKDNLYQILQ